MVRVWLYLARLARPGPRARKSTGGAAPATPRVTRALHLHAVEAALAEGAVGLRLPMDALPWLLRVRVRVYPNPNPNPNPNTNPNPNSKPNPNQARHAQLPKKAGGPHHSLLGAPSEVASPSEVVSEAASDAEIDAEIAEIEAEIARRSASLGLSAKVANPSPSPDP